MIAILFHFIFFSATQVSPLKPGEKEQKVYDKSNPIRSLAFLSKGNQNFALLVLARDTSKNNVNLMRSTNPDDPNSYIIAKDLSSDIKKLPGNKWKIALEGAETNDTKTVYSIQIREGNNIHQTEPFYYNKKENKFMLVRERSDDSFFTTENIVYICLAVLAVIVAVVIGYVICCKK